MINVKINLPIAITNEILLEMKICIFQEFKVEKKNKKINKINKINLNKLFKK